MFTSIVQRNLFLNLSRISHCHDAVSMLKYIHVIFLQAGTFATQPQHNNQNREVNTDTLPAAPPQTPSELHQLFQ